MSFYRFKHNIASIKHSYCTRYKQNVNICIPNFKKQLALNSSLSTATQICRQLNINIYNFNSIYIFKSF